MKRHIVVLVMFAVLSLGIGALAAQTASFSVYHDVMGLPTDPIPEFAPATTIGKGVTGMRLTRGPGVTPAALTNGFSSQGWNFPNPTRAGALDVGAYFQFGLTVDSGSTASLSSVSMSLRRTAVNAPMNFELQVSFDGFATPGTTITTFNYYGRTSGTALYPNPQDFDKYYHMHSDLPGHGNTTTSPGDPIEPIDLTKVNALQNIPGGTEVTFRLYAWGNDKTTATNTVALGRVNGPRIEGTVQAQ